MRNMYATAAFAVLLVFALTGCEFGGDAGRDGFTAESAGSGILIVSYDPDSADTIAAPGTDSMIVLDWLRYGCDSLHRPLEIQEYAFGDLVVAISWKHNGEEGYWLYKVNGEPVPKGMSAHRVSSSDTVLIFFK